MDVDQSQRYKDRLVEIIDGLDTIESITINFTADQRNTFYQIKVQGRRMGPIEPEEMRVEEEDQSG